MSDDEEQSAETQELIRKVVDEQEVPQEGDDDEKEAKTVEEVPLP